jgi:uncharacterized protein YecT (DUF1311 family)
MKFSVRATLAVSLAIGASVPGPGRAMAPPAQATTPLEEQCEAASTKAETESCYVAAAAKARAEVERAFERELRTAIAQDIEFNAFARLHHMPGSTLAVQLNASQAAWRRYSQSQCSFEGGSSFGGSGTDIIDAPLPPKFTAPLGT